MKLDAIRRALALTPAPVPPPAARPVARATSTAVSDTFTPTTTGATGLGLAARERLASRLIAAVDRQTWAADGSEKLRLAATLADLRTASAADALMREWPRAKQAASPPRQAGFARVIGELVAERPSKPRPALPAATQERVLAFMAEELGRATTPELKHQWAIGLALSRTEAGADTLIAGYRASSGTEREFFTRMLGYAGTERATAFLMDEYDRLGADPAARAQVLEALQEGVAGPTG